MYIYNLPSDGSAAHIGIDHMIGVRCFNEAEIHELSPRAMYLIGALGRLYLTSDADAREGIDDIVSSEHPSEYPAVLGCLNQLIDYKDCGFSLNNYFRKNGGFNDALHLYLDVSSRFTRNGVMLPYDQCIWHYKELWMDDLFCQNLCAYLDSIEWFKMNQIYPGDVF